MGACNAVRLALIEEESPFGGLFLKQVARLEISSYL